jgi:hypothetical protein
MRLVLDHCIYSETVLDDLGRVEIVMVLEKDRAGIGHYFRERSVEIDPRQMPESGRLGDLYQFGRTS